MSITTLSDYGSVFQNKLFKFLIEDKIFFFSLHGVLRPEYFSEKKYRDLYKVITKHYEKYSDLPPYNILKIYAQKISDNDKKESMIRLINEIQMEEGNSEFFLDEAIRFCKRNEIKETLIDSVDLLQNEEYEKIEERLMSLMRKINVDVHGHNYWENFDVRAAYTRYNLIPTGWDVVDSITKGGLGAGELGVVCAVAGAGKSHFLVDLGCNAAKIGKNVLYISLELYSNVVETRIDANLTGIEFDKIRFHKEIVKKKLQKFKEEGYGEIFVKYFPTGSVTVQQLKAYTNQVKATYFNPDIILIDYADIIKPGRFYKDAHRLEQKGIYEDLRGWAGEMEKPIWTASQARKDAIDKDWIGIEDLADSFGKAGVADLIFGLVRRMSQRLDNAGKLFLAKSRISKDGYIFPITLDSSISKLIVNESDYDETKDILSGVKKNESGRVNMSSRKKENVIKDLKEEFGIQ